MAMHWLTNLKRGIANVFLSSHRSLPRRKGRPSSFAAEVSYLEPRQLLAAAFAEFVDPNINPDNLFGYTVTQLSTGNVVVTSPLDDAGGLDAGAVYLFNGQSGSLISKLTGAQDNDRIGFGQVIELANGNFLVVSPDWDNGAVIDAGAVTFGSGLTGVSGKVSAVNSLVGTKDNDMVGFGGVTLLDNGNYIVSSYNWDNGTASDVGAVTWGSGTTGVKGNVSAANSLVGTTTDDRVGIGGITVLANQNYVVRSYQWDNGAAADAGAVTWGSGTTGVKGNVSATNSLIGSTVDDNIGEQGVTALSNGNYVVTSINWTNGVATDAGAVTFGNGSTGITGVVSATNSLVGSKQDDSVGLDGITELANQNFTIGSRLWDNGTATDAGAVTWASGTTGITGAVSAANSLVGSNTNDNVGNSGVAVLQNGNYVVSSGLWDNVTVINAGAVTWGNGSTGVKGVVSAGNSLVGSAVSDHVGNNGIVLLPGGNYLVRSSLWDNGAATNVGAVTWGNGATGVRNPVSPANSLVGSTTNDAVGTTVVLLENGNYVVTSPTWDNGAAVDAGAATWGSGNAGVRGVITAANSLLGTRTGDQVGLGGILPLANGNYVVNSYYWANGTTAAAGAATWGDGTIGVVGTISATNSLVGNKVADFVGFGSMTALSNGNYVIGSSNWDIGAATQVGAYTWGDGTTGVVGVVSVSNSLIGSTASDFVGSRQVFELTNGNFVATSDIWDNGAVVDAGAATWGDGTSGIVGTIGVANSLVGTTAFDNVGKAVIPLTNGNYLVHSSVWDNGANTNAGAVTWGNGTTGVSGAVSAANSLVGSTAGDSIGFYGVIPLTNGNYVVNSVSWDNGVIPNVGAVTWGNGATGITGAVNRANSLTGRSAEDQVGNGGVTPLENGNYLATSYSWDNGALIDAGATTFGDGATGVRGAIATENSAIGLTGNTALQQPILDEIHEHFFVRFLTEYNGKIRVGSMNTGFANQIPTVSGTLANQPVNDNATIAPFATVVVNDPDTQAMFVRISIVNGVNRGDFTPASTAGWTRTVNGAVINYHRSFSTAANIGSDVQAAIRTLVFKPRMNAIAPGATEPTAFTIFLNDQIANSTDTSTSVITTSVNDNEQISGTVANQPVNDNATVAPFAALTVTDPDTQAANAKVTISNGTVRGDFTVASRAGWTRSVNGFDIVYTRVFNAGTNIGQTVQNAIRALVFQPRTNAVTVGLTETTGFTVFVSDGIGSAAANSTTTVVTTSVNDNEQISGAVANQQVNDNATIAPFLSVIVTDPDTQGANAKVTISNGTVRGDFTVVSRAGWTRSVNGFDIVYTRVFNVGTNIGQTVQNAIRALVFQPRNNALPIGQKETTAFTIFVSDGVGTAATNNTTTVVTTSVPGRIADAIPFADASIVVVPSITKKPGAALISRLMKRAR